MATLKQKLVVGKILENPSISYYRAMIEAGYSPNTAQAPSQNLLNQKGYRELLVKHGIDEATVMKKIQEGLEADKLFGKNAIKHPDYATQHRYLETAMKLLGMTLPEPGEGGNTYNTFIQQNNLDPNAPDARKLVDATLKSLMDSTKLEK